jgi:hypothetical protein
MTNTRLPVAIVCAGLLLPVSAIASQADFVPGTKHTCYLHLATGKPYVLQTRTFHWKKNEIETYTTAVAFYAPGSGEFLWFGSDYTPDQYFRYGKTYSTPGCTDAQANPLLLQDGEWANFWAINCSLWVFHSNLKFPSIGKGWWYVAEHPNESSSTPFGGKWVESIYLDKLLGSDFFHRPERLRYDARPYVFQPLIGVKKVGSNWELQIQGTDEKALVVLDKNFRVVKIAKPSGKRR